MYMYMYVCRYIYMYIYTYNRRSNNDYSNVRVYSIAGYGKGKFPFPLACIDQVLLQQMLGTHWSTPGLQDSRLFGPRPWKILATTYDKKGFLSNPDPGENLVSGNLVMETGCTSLCGRSLTEGFGGVHFPRPTLQICNINDYSKYVVNILTLK